PAALPPRFCPRSWLSERISYLSWWPGGRFVFSRRLTSDDTEIYAAGTDGSELRRLASSCEDEDDPAWSRDGRRIAYSRGHDVYVMDASGAAKRRVAAGRDPTWSPDGTQLVLVRGGQLYAVAA